MRASNELGAWMLAAVVAGAVLGCANALENRGILATRYVDGDTGWAVGASGLVLQTRDGGKTWVRRESGVNAPLRALAVAKTSDGRYAGIAAGDHGAFLRTRDGSRWSRVDVSLSETLRSAAANRDGTLLLVSGDSGTLLRSTDYGVSWTSIPVGAANVTEVAIDTKKRLALARDDAGALWESRDGALHFELVSGTEETLAANVDH
jgi:photosystem II stability/assembly factor-like uncharacterized protein